MTLKGAGILLSVLSWAAGAAFSQEITSVNPSSSSQHTKLSVAITGTNTHFTTVFEQATPIWFTQASPTIIIPTSFIPVHDELLIAELEIPANVDPGMYDLNILNSIDGLMTLPDAFEVLAFYPVITSVTPSESRPGKSLAVTITGSNTNFSGATDVFTQATYFFTQATPVGGYFAQGSPVATFSQGTGTDAYSEITSVTWLSGGGQKIYSTNCSAKGPSFLKAVFDIPADAYTGPWDLHVINYGLPSEELILPNAFDILPSGDVSNDGVVNMQDVSIVAGDWLKGYPETIYEIMLDSNPGWSTQGQWAFGVPAGQGGDDHGNPDPSSGYTGQNVFGVNLNGDYATSVGGPYYLTTTPMDCRGFKDVHLRFKRWLNTDYAPFVESTVEISDNGSDWYIVWDHSGEQEITDSSWKTEIYDISNVADNATTVYLRWGYRINDHRAFPYSGWNIDDIVLVGKR